MLDKIIIVSKHEARFVFDDRVPFTICSDVDVIPLLLLFLGHPYVEIFTIRGAVTIQLRTFSDEITMEIETKDVA
jgi:hypothetical protein